MTGFGRGAARRSGRSCARCAARLLALVGTSVGLTVLISPARRVRQHRRSQNDGPHTIDQLHFVHQPLTGDGTVVARVLTQQDSHEWAKAGLLVKDGTGSGSPYAAVMVTPRHGVRLQANFDTELAGSSATAPRGGCG